MVTLSYTLWKHKMIGAMDVNVLETQRSNPFHILSSSHLLDRKEQQTTIRQMEVLLIDVLTEE